MAGNSKPKPPFQDKPLILQVYEWLRDSIYRGEHKVDDRLNIDKLSQAWGISKTPIRESLNALCKDGLVDYAPRRGFFVKRLSYKELMDVLELREALELYCLYRYFKTYDRIALMDFLSRFESTFTSLRATGSPDDYLDVDADFHTFLVQSTGNQQIADTYRVLDTNLRYMRLHDTAFLKELAGATISEHKTIINAILEGNRKLAMYALMEHLDSVRERFTRIYASEKKSE